MKSFASIASAPGGVLLCMLAFLLLGGQTLLLIHAVWQRRGLRRVLSAALHLLGGALFLILLLDGVYTLDYLPYPRAYAQAVQTLYALPWFWIAGLEAADAGLLALGAAGLHRYELGHPSAQTVKQTVDLLPTGLCIAAEDGTVLLSNLAMNRWARLLMGGTLSNAGALWERVASASEEQGGKRLLRLDDGTALLLAERELTLDGRPYRQFSAEDVTEQYRVTRALEEKNARLRDLQLRMKSYQVRESELLMRQELLAARATVHKQLGGALLTGKYHLEHPESTDPDTLRLMLRQINDYLLAEVDDPEPQEDAWEAALRLAAGIGVTVSVSGEVPRGGALRALLGQAVSECAINTVKHAAGKELEVTVTADAFRIVNDGAPPDGEIRPSGGLLSLRQAADQAGGRMELESRPRFALTIRL